MRATGLIATCAATAVLRGCAAVSDTSTSSSSLPASSTAAVSSMSTTDPHDVTSWLNSLYQGFDASESSSPLGVTISMQDEFRLYCTEAPGEKCYQGHADCRYSASLYNHKMMLSAKTNSIKLTMDRSAGIVFNQSLVESSIGKCSFIFDGGSFNRYNGACGCLAMSGSCSDPHSAFGNVCPSTGKTCTVKDSEVDRCSCDVTGDSGNKVMGCFHTGPGYDRSHIESSRDQLRDMVKARLRHQSGTAIIYGQPVVLLEYWNEVVIDESLLLKQLQEDPVAVIPAFIYAKGSYDGKSKASKMRDSYRKQFNVQANIPLVAVDTTVRADSKRGPFVIEIESDAAVLV